MRKSLLVLLSSFPILPALAASPDQTAPAAAAPGVPLQERLGAMRHHQPSRAEVTGREDQAFGRQEVQDIQHQQNGDVDQLYTEIMRMSAPSKP